jgi:FkbM family methyltransferase
MSHSFIRKIAYTVLDLIALKRGVTRKINNMKIRFPAKWSRYYQGNYEEENYFFLQEQVKPGMHIMDIGAHIGLFSSCSSQLTGPEGRIICFEPTPGTFSILKKTLRLNHCDNVTAVQAAVSDKEGSATFFVSHREGGNSNSLVKNRLQGESDGYDVKLVTIDSSVQNYSLQPSIIKIDAEGVELDVLKGGLKTFEQYKPILIIGLHPEFIKQKGDSLEAIWELLAEAGYQLQRGKIFFSKFDFCNQTQLFEVHCFSTSAVK